MNDEQLNNPEIENFKKLPKPTKQEDWFKKRVIIFLQTKV